MVTTIDINGFYTVSGSPDLKLQARIYVPDHGGPIFPCYVATQAPHFTGDGTWGPATQCLQTFAEAGILCLGFGVRSLNPLPNQMDDGAWHKQTDDCHAAIQYMRQGGPIETTHGFQVSGYVGILGGSGSASHAAYCVADGTAGDDKADSAVVLSGDMDFSDRESDVTAAFIQKSAQYAGVSDTDLVNLRARSPIALDLANANDMIHYNGTHENMPFSNLTLYRDERLGHVGSKGAGNYEWHANNDDPVGGGLHAFAMWTPVKQHVTDWVLASIAAFGGNEPPPPPDPTGRVKVTVLISNLAPGQTLQFNAGAHDNVTGLDGPVSSFEFISDRADSGGSGSLVNPTGVYTLVDAVEGVITGDISTRAWLGFDYVDGAVLPTSWKALNPTSPSSFDWSQTDAFMAACFGADKQAGLAISMGIKDPLWIYSGGHRVTGFTVHSPNTGTIPIPWDPNYLGVMKKFVIALSQKYASNATLGYLVVSGLGQLLDTLLVQASADYDNLNNLAVAAGYANLVAGWTATSNGILDLWSKAFPTIPVYLALNTPVPASDGGLMAIDEFARAAIDRYRARLGLMTLQLDGLTAAGPDLSLNSIIRDARRTTRAYRFLWPSSDPNCDPSQDAGSYVPETGLVNAATAGINIGVQMEEFYEADILTVTNNYPTHFASFQSDLTDNAI